MTGLTYRARMGLLRDTKIRHTQEKVKQNGYMDVDDYGTVPLPSNFSFKPIPNRPDGRYYGAQGFSVNYAALLEAHPIYVDPLESMCGRWRAMLPSYRFGWPEGEFPFDHLKKEQALYGLSTGIGADAHFACDYRIGLRLGWGGLLEKVRSCRGLAPSEFYDAEERVILAIQAFIARHTQEIRRLLEAEEREELRASLAEMLECNEWIVENPPRTFLEACQWVAWFSIVSRIYDRDGAGCQLDLILLPYYESSTAAGILDDEKATFILANLLLIDTHYYQICGASETGADLTNRVSWLILDAAHWLNSSANITVRVHDNLDPTFMKKAVEYLFNDRNGWPRFSGDRGLLGFMKKGYTLRDARDRIAVGCNWMAVPGREYPLNDCIKINVAKVLEVAFHEMMDAGAPSMEHLWSLLERHLAQAVDVTAAGINHHLAHQHAVMPELVMNLMMENTIERGLDITQCADMFTIGIDGSGLGTVADSLAALEQRVVREGLVSWCEVHDALHSNFEGQGGERLRLMLASSERYCQGNSLGDKWAVRVSQLLTALVNAQPMPEGRQLVPGWFSWSSTIAFGKQVGATPNGRVAGSPITHGANPTPGFRSDGAPTAMSSGIASIQPGYGNPAPIQLELDPRLTAEEGGVERVMQLIKTHCDLGGTLININVLDKAKLMEAHQDPSLHPDLVVRVTGFTAYFASLSPAFRQLVVDRFVEGV